MGDQISFIIKIIVFSLILSLIIKHGGQWLDIAPTPLAAMVGVLAPTLILGLLLGWRGQSKPEN